MSPLNSALSDFQYYSGVSTNLRLKLLLAPAKRSIVAACVATLVVTGCSSISPRAVPEWVGQPLPQIAQQAMDSRGSIVSSEPLTSLPDDVKAKIGEARKAVYRSVSATTGEGTEVSGTFFLPKESPPQGGWPVIAFAHGSTGLTNDCGPSAHPDLLGYASAIGFLVSAGYAVAFTDFEGLGHPGRHPYLEPRTAGFNVIDSVRALRELFNDVSTRWMALGGSQGGQASWAANEYAIDYGAGLDLVGSVALAPAADMSGLASAALNGNLTKDQIALMPLVIAGLEVTNPDLVESDYLRGAAAENKQTLMSCSGDKAGVFPQLGAEQVRPVTPQAAEYLYTLLKADTLPQRTLTAPMLVINGGADPLVLPQWVSSAVSRACAMGGVVKHDVVEGRGHTNIDLGNDAYQWVSDRFAGEAASSNCGG